MVAVALLAYEFWMTPQAKVSPGTSGRTWRLMAGIGSLVILLSIGLVFWKSAFGLFHAEVLVMAERIRFDVLPWYVSAIGTSLILVANFLRPPEGADKKR